jgi:RNA polymerase sigma-70 factor (ECF subfamily)
VDDRSETASGPDGDEAFRAEFTELIPQLRAFARSLIGDARRADNLVHEAMRRAWAARQSFWMGANMKAWAFKILHRRFHARKRRSGREDPRDQAVGERIWAAMDDPAAPLALDELRIALVQLPEEQRDALILVSAGGLTYEDAALICDCAVGTIKSRVSRARVALAEILNQVRA